MSETYKFLLGPHGVFEGTLEEVLQSGFNPWQSQLFEGVYNRAQYGDTPFTWSGYGLPGGEDLGLDYATGYLPDLLDLRTAVQAGTATALERQRYEQMVQAAQAIPLRDVSQLTYDASTSGTGQTLSGASPDLGGIMLALADKLDAGTATEQERALFKTTNQALREQNWRASVPQPSDVPFGFGDNLFGALAILGTGVTGGLAAAPLAAGGAGLATTLGSLGTLAGTAGGWASTIGGATGQGWLSTLGKALGAAGGIAGGIGGLSGAFSGGISGLGDAAKLASSTGRILGAVGTAVDSPALRQAASYLSTAGNLGRAGSGVQGLLQSATQAQEAGPQAVQSLVDTGGRMADFTYEDFIGWGDPYGPGSSGDFDQAYRDFLSWEDPYGPGSSGDPAFSGDGGGGLLSTLGGLASGVGKLLGGSGGLGGAASWLGPAVSGLAGLGTGLIGSNAADRAAALQSQYLNRALDLQTAQWLQQQQNQAPWLEAGRLALGDMTGRAQWAQPTLGQVAPISGANYALPSATPGWTPQTYAGYTPVDVPSAAGYRYTPGQVPSAAAYRYTPGQVPAASQYRYTPGALPTLSGAELLANDPGVQFRLDEGRRALEASAAARGGLTSGATLAALQRQGQELSSQEYANAWNRAAQQAQMREQWGQQASTLGFGQAMSEAQLREQVNQIASQQGWSQAQAETVLREQLAQQAGQQNWQQALQEAQARAQQQQFGWSAGLQAQQAGQQEARQYETDLYNRLMQQSQTQYGRDWAQREAENQRLMDAYNALRQGQTTAWNQFASLAGLGQTAVGQLGTQGQAATNQLTSLLGSLGTAQASGVAGGASNWLQALGNINQGIQGSLNTQSILGALQSLNR